MKPSSIKSRIKTVLQQFVPPKKTDMKPSSIKSRIKTEMRVILSKLKEFIWNHLPLKVGLRPFRFIRFVKIYVIWNHLPLKVGLRLLTSSPGTFRRKHMKPSSIKSRIKTLEIRLLCCFCKRYMKPSSIKSRIKTF